MEKGKQLAVWSAGVTTQPLFVEKITNLALYQGKVRNLKVVDASSMHYAIDLRAKIKKDYSEIEEFRKQAVALPNAQAKFVNDATKGVKLAFEKMQRDVGVEIQKQKTVEEEKAKQIASEEVKVELLDENGGVEIVMTGEVKAVPPPNVVRTDGGVSVHTRGVPKIVVDDKLAFVKAVVSTAKGNQAWTLDMIEIKETAVKAAAKEKAGDKREIKIPGGKYWTEDKLI